MRLDISAVLVTVLLAGTTLAACATGSRNNEDTGPPGSDAGSTDSGGPDGGIDADADDDGGRDAGPSDGGTDGGNDDMDAGGCPDADEDGVCDEDDVCADADDMADADGDGVPDACDICPDGDDAVDSDSDGVPDACDSCDGSDDTLDADGDGVPDGCDVCDGGDDTLDTDGDGVPNACDDCAADDTMDADGDGVPDGCDVCPGSDDAVDGDSDGVPDGCDECAGSDDMVDSDTDGVPDGCDACPGSDDALDTDGDGVPNGCDACRGSDDSADADGDGVADGCDACPGSDDSVDADGDGVPDGCDACAGSDDGADADSDGVPDGCDVCAGSDDTLDSDGDGVPNGCDVCPGSDDGVDSDGDGVPDGCDVCAGFDDGMDSDGDGVPDGCDSSGTTCESGGGGDSDGDGVTDSCDLCSSGGPSILLYDQSVNEMHGQQAIELIGCTFTRTNPTDFVSDLGSGSYDLLVMDMPSGKPSGSWEAAVETFVQDGGAAILATWDLGSHATLASAFGVTAGAGRSTPTTFSVTENDPIFVRPRDVTGSSFSPSSSDPWGNNGNDLTVNDGFSHATIGGGQAIVRSNGGRTFANGFLLDDYVEDEDGDGNRDIVELVANQIVAATGAIRNELYALPYDYFDWGDAAADLVYRAVHFRRFDAPVYGSARVVGAVSECVDTSGNTSSSSPGGPYSGEFNATIAALEHAGHPSGDVMTLADASAAQSAVGSYDVLLFMEQESCTATASATWIATVREHIHRGGRVVVTTARGGTGTFIDGLGLFGTGAQTTDASPYTTSGGAFWTGISHPGALNATDAWTWSGNGFESLATDSGGNHTVWRYYYSVP